MAGSPAVPASHLPSRVNRDDHDLRVLGRRGPGGEAGADVQQLGLVRHLVSQVGQENLVERLDGGRAGKQVVKSAGEPLARLEVVEDDSLALLHLLSHVAQPVHVGSDETSLAAQDELHLVAVFGIPGESREGPPVGGHEHGGPVTKKHDVDDSGPGGNGERDVHVGLLGRQRNVLAPGHVVAVGGRVSLHLFQVQHLLRVSQLDDVVLQIGLRDLKANVGRGVVGHPSPDVDPPGRKILLHVFGNLGVKDGGELVGVVVKAKVKGGAGGEVVVGLLQVVRSGRGFVFKVEGKLPPEPALDADSDGGVPGSVVEGRDGRVQSVGLAQVCNFNVLASLEVRPGVGAKHLADSGVLQKQVAEESVAADGNVVDVRLDVREEARSHHAGVQPHEGFGGASQEGVSGGALYCGRGFVGVLGRVGLRSVEDERERVRSEADVLLAGTLHPKVDERFVGEAILIAGQGNEAPATLHADDGASCSVGKAGHVFVGGHGVSVEQRGGRGNGHHVGVGFDAGGGILIFLVVASVLAPLAAAVVVVMVTSFFSPLVAHFLGSRGSRRGHRDGVADNHVGTRGHSCNDGFRGIGGHDDLATSLLGRRVQLFVEVLVFREGRLQLLAQISQATRQLLLLLLLFPGRFGRRGKSGGGQSKLPRGSVFDGSRRLDNRRRRFFGLFFDGSCGRR